MDFAFSDGNRDAMEEAQDCFIPIGDALAGALQMLADDFCGVNQRDPAAAALAYLDYLKTDHWRATRQRALLRAGRQCKRCGSRRTLEVHHLSYKRLGREADADLMVLCGDCHAAEHEKTAR